jgi:secreted trypsin-like serine protease
MCAGGEGRDVCQVRLNFTQTFCIFHTNPPFQGFGGAPLLVTENGITNQIGIMSFGSENCGGLRIPSVYTSIAHFYNWIQENIPIE